MKCKKHGCDMQRLYVSVSDSELEILLSPGHPLSGNDVVSFPRHGQKGYRERFKFKRWFCQRCASDSGYKNGVLTHYRTQASSYQVSYPTPNPNGPLRGGGGGAG